MTNLAENASRETGTAPRVVHIVDALKGPLVGAGRFRRMLPFAVTATLSLVIAVPATSWKAPALAAVGQIVLAIAIVGAMLTPWHRLPRHAQLLPPLLFLVGTVMLADATGDGIGSPFVSLSVLPLMWLAIYEQRIAVLLAASLAGIGLWFAAPDQTSQLATSDGVTLVVFIVVCGGMGVTLHGLVGDARNATRALRDQQLTLEHGVAVLDALPERVSRYRISDHTITYCNPAWATQYRVDPEAAIGRVLDDFLSDDEIAGLDAQLALLSPSNPILVDTTARATDGPDRQWLEWVDRYLIGPDGPEILSIGRDVTRRQVAEMDLAASEAGFRDLADNSVDVVWRFSTDPSPHFDYMSPSVDKILGYPASYFLEDFSRMMGVLDEEGRVTIAKALNGKHTLDHSDLNFRHANGSIVVGETRTALIRGGMQGVSRDVTELRGLQDRLEALALRDPLTGLSNRRLFDELLATSLSRAERSGSPLAIAFLDLDGLKYVNDVYGHDAGDIVLCETARRLRATVRGADTVARLGGDEFVVLYAPNEVLSQSLIARIDAALSEPIEITANISVTCPASLGVADTGTVGYDSAVLLAAADEAMYAAKRARRVTRDAKSPLIRTTM